MDDELERLQEELEDERDAAAQCRELEEEEAEEARRAADEADFDLGFAEYEQGLGSRDG